MRPVFRILRIVLGSLLLALGVIGLLVPVMPQWPFLAAGALLLAPYVRVFRRMSAWIHKRYPQYRGPLRHFRDYKRPLRRPDARPSTLEKPP